MQSSARNLATTRWRRPVLLGALVLWGALASISQPGTHVLADNDSSLKDTARKLAERVAAMPGLHGPLRLEWHADAHWAGNKDVRWQETLRDEFAHLGLPLGDETGAPVLSVYAELTAAQLVLTAKTRVGDREEVRIVAVPRAALPPAETTAAPLQLHRQLVYQSADLILDAATLSNGASGGLGVLLYKNFEVVALRVDSKGEVTQTVLLNVAGLKPARNPHGELMQQGGRMSVQLWGKACDFPWESPAEVKCRTEKASSLEKSAWRMDPVLASPCDESHWTLSEGGGNDLTASEIPPVRPEGAHEVGGAMMISEFPGPVLNINDGQDAGSALIVVRNLRTGNYEVYKITLVCGG